VQSAIVIDVPLDQITFVKDPAAKNYRTHLSVLALLKDAQGRIVQKYSQDIPYQGPLDKLDAARAGHFIYTQHANVPPGRYTLETAVLDREGEKVSARKSVYVAPAGTGGVALSSLSFIRRLESEAGSGELDDPYHFEGGKITPTLAETMPGGPSSQISLFFVIYPARDSHEPPELIIEFLHEGNVMGRATPQLPLADTQGRIPYVATSPIEQLKAGEYEVRVTVKQGAAAVQGYALFSIP